MLGQTAHRGFCSTQAPHGSSRQRGFGSDSQQTAGRAGSQGGGGSQPGGSLYGSGSGEALMPTEEQLPGLPRRAPKRPAPAKCV